MVKKRKTGVGLLTCGRPQTFAKLFRDVVSNPSVDFVVVVKNRSEDYGELSPRKLVETEGRGKAICVEIPEEVGVGCCKNVALMRLVQASCSHLFLIEDDMEIKKPEVFEKYAQTAEAFGVHHLNFGACWDEATQRDLQPAYALVKPDTGEKIDIYKHLCGSFSYYSSIAIWQAGLIDSKRFFNALDHVEHTYRLGIMGMTFPFRAFADVHKSAELLGYTEAGHVSTLPDSSSRERIGYGIAGAVVFEQRYGKSLREVHSPDPKQLAASLSLELVEA